MSKLRIAPELGLDPDYVGGGTFALLAKKGAGKTYTGRVMAEEFWKAKVPFVVLDPMDAWWGLRSSADGKSEGIPVAIFGGPHGDAPLERASGKLMADLAVDEGLSMVLSLKHFGARAAERQFALDFLERLYRRNSELVHLFIDEADLFAPQKPQAGDQPLLGVTENIVRRGRNSGIGITLITQRPAVLNKDVLTQVDGLVAMRIIGLNDREAIDKWVEGHGDDPDLADKVKGTLASLANGECWWWIPELGILKRVNVRTSDTFDSSPTRTRGSGQRAPKSFADVDMGAIETKIAETIERAKADDPKELRKQIRDLQAQAKKRPAETQTVEVEKVVEVPVFNGELEDLHRLIEECGRVSLDLKAAAGPLESAATAVMAGAEKVADAVNLVRVGTPTPPRERSRHGTDRRTARGARPPAERDRPAPRADRRDSGRPRSPQDGGRAVGEDSFAPSGPQQRILDALAALEAIGVLSPDKTQLALFSQASPKSSSYTNNLGALRTNGLIDYPGQRLVVLTEDGRAIADAGAVPTTLDELHAYVATLVGPAKWRLLEVLIEAGEENPVAKTDLADWAGASPTSSSFTNNLGSLRSLGLIDYPSPGNVAALPILFLDA